MKRILQLMALLSIVGSLESKGTKSVPSPTSQKSKVKSQKKTKKGYIGYIAGAVSLVLIGSIYILTNKKVAQEELESPIDLGAPVKVDKEVPPPAKVEDEVIVEPVPFKSSDQDKNGKEPDKEALQGKGVCQDKDTISLQEKVLDLYSKLPELLMQVNKLYKKEKKKFNLGVRKEIHNLYEKEGKIFQEIEKLEEEIKNKGEDKKELEKKKKE